MNAQFNSLTNSSESSLTLIVDDMLRHHRDGTLAADGDPDDLQDWVNALQRQATPLVFSASGRASLEAWLDVVGQSAS